MRGSIRLGRIAGIDIGVHYTWLLAFSLIAWSLAVGFFPIISPGGSQATYWIVGVIAALLLFVSVLIHEMAHSLVATARGLKVQGITLFIFGGVSNIESEPEKPQVEFFMAVVGPLSSLVLAGILWVVGLQIGVYGSPLSLLTGALPLLGSSGVALIYYLSSINILLGLFNLLPGFPLDGGRVLRSIIWRITGSVTRATNAASTVGQVFGWGFIAYGLYRLFYGDFLNGLWIAFIGWFLSNAAGAGRQEVSLREHLRGVRVGDIMDTSPECVGTQTPVQDVVQQNFIQHSRRSAAVCEGERLAGIVTLPDVKKLPQEMWGRTPVSEIMTRSPIYSVKQDDDLNAALKILAEYGLNQLPVVEGERLVGFLNRADIVNYLQLSQELGIKRSSGR